MATPPDAQDAVIDRLVLCNSADVPAGTALEIEIDQYFLAVFNVGGTFYVTDNNCTHGPGLLAEGYLDGRVVECDFHSGRFDVATGAVVGPPCIVAIKTYPAAVQDGKVVIEVE